MVSRNCRQFTDMHERDDYCTLRGEAFTTDVDGLRRKLIGTLPFS